ncbi:MAG: DUF4126 domain-containing protein [Lutibacter sp.]|uniref:DUF4126 domain-containing protein n=1 Tax=Lutibacter sp. TaxID=1925666 RepID=UPI0018307360|nr:DUF4126 domain-containing protein [Lutibacter sp.]MBT8317024.1 DUF4126 domain-containing protein [Lutibacter sp.]NNJ57884.1 DUF4126 domain-containing protein [Lutibacter sp.]
MSPETIFSILVGIGLAASVGFRIFVPLFALSLASYFNIIPLNENWQWVSSSSALIILGVATIVEVIAYFIPFLDNLLDTIAVPLAAIAGTAVMVATVSELDPTFTWALAIIAGGGTAAAIKGSTSTTRLASTTTTAGIANPVISTVETGTSIVMSFLAIFIPVIAMIFVIFIFWILFKVFKLFKSSKSVK